MHGIAHDEDVDPAGFGAWGFEALLHDRLPRYQKLADRYGYAVEARDVARHPRQRRFHGTHAQGDRRPRRLRVDGTKAIAGVPPFPRSNSRDSYKCPSAFPTICPPAKSSNSEGVVVMDSTRAARQDIRPLQIGLLNLMPNKERTETQFARLVGSTPLQIDFTLIRISEHKSKNTSEEYLNTFYSKWEDIRSRKFDGFIVTGAPIAHLPFEEVRYWPEMVEIMNWTQTNVHSPLFICWGVQAALYHFHGVSRKRRTDKAVGIYRHQNMRPNSPYLRGFSDDFAIPVSRYNDIDRSTLPTDGTSRNPDRQQSEVGICMLEDHKYRSLYMLNHFEYDNRSLADEYERDVNAGLSPSLPVNYFPDDDPSREPLNKWRAHGASFLPELDQSRSTRRHPTISTESVADRRGSPCKAGAKARLAGVVNVGLTRSISLSRVS